MTVSSIEHPLDAATASPDDAVRVPVLVQRAGDRWLTPGAMLAVVLGGAVFVWVLALLLILG